MPLAFKIFAIAILAYHNQQIQTSSIKPTDNNLANMHVDDEKSDLNFNCTYWNAPMSIETHDQTGQILIMFEPYGKCFNHFEMALHKLFEDKCDIGDRVENITFQNNFPEVSKIIFEVNSSGNYCVQVYPLNCLENPACRKYYSQVFNIDLEHTESEGLNVSPRSSRVHIGPTTLALLILLAVLVVFSFLYLMWTKKLPVRTLPGEDAILLTEYLNRPHISVLILHTNDSSTKNRVFALVDLFRKCSKIHFKLWDENKDEIDDDGGENWMRTHLDIPRPFDKNLTCLRKIILVESERAALHQDHSKKGEHNFYLGDNDEESKNCPLFEGIEEEDLIFEKLFSHGLKELMSQGEEAFDDFRLLVVKFGDDPTDRGSRLEIPGSQQRYYLPRDILTLRADLEARSPEDLPELDDFYQQLKSAMKKNPYYSSFAKDFTK